MNSKPLSLSNKGGLDKWRAGGRSDRTFLLLFALAIAALVLLAAKVASSAPVPQAGGDPGWHRGMGPPGPEQQLGWLSDNLKLTDDQKAKIKPILEDQQKQMTALREDSSLSREEKHAKFRQIHTATFDQIRPILTEEQQAKLKQMEAQREQRMKAHKPPSEASPPNQ